VHTPDVVLCDDIQGQLLLGHKHVVGAGRDLHRKALDDVVEGGAEEQQLHLHGAGCAGMGRRGRAPCVAGVARVAWLPADGCEGAPGAYLRGSWTARLHAPFA